MAWILTICKAPCYYALTFILLQMADFISNIFYRKWQKHFKVNVNILIKPLSKSTNIHVCAWETSLLVVQWCTISWTNVGYFGVDIGW